MANVVATAIKKQLDHVVAQTDVNTAVMGLRQFSQNQLPAAMVATSDARVLRIANGEYHLVYRQAWAIVDDSPLTAQEIAEKMMWLWLTNPYRQELADLNVVSVVLNSADAPMVTPSSDGRYEAYLEFEFRVAIANPL